VTHVPDPVHAATPIPTATAHGEQACPEGAAGHSPRARLLPVEQRPASASRVNPVVWLLSGLVRGYQLIVSPWFAPSCRYYPSCSAYAIGSLRTHGAIKGSLLAGWRLLRCNPWSAGGVDHVPARGSWPSKDADGTHTHDHESEGEPEGRTLGSRTSRRA